MKKEYDFSNGKLNKKPLADPKKPRVLTSIRLDWVVFQWFMHEAERTGVPYQMLINFYLKQAIDTPSPKELEERLRNVEKVVFKKVAGRWSLTILVPERMSVRAFPAARLANGFSNW